MSNLTTPIQPWSHLLVHSRAFLPTVGWAATAFLLVGCTDVDGLKELPRPDLSGDDSEVEDDDAGPNQGDQGRGDNGDNSTGDNEDPIDTGEVGDTGDGPSTPEDDAEIVWVDLPSSMQCGTTYIASVEVRNTGLNTWTKADGYKLGTVDDQDYLYGPSTRVWLPEAVSIAPGETHVFDFVLTAPGSAADYLTDWQMVHESVRWFGESTAEAVSVTCQQTQTICDPLTGPALQAGFSDKDVRGGSFSSAGWQTTDDEDQLLLELSSGLSGSGIFEIDVTNFDPTTQYSQTKHQIINMYTSDNGSQDVFNSNEAWWNIRTGTNYGTGLKVLAAGNGGDSRHEARLIQTASWNPADTHTFTVEWDSQEVVLYLNGHHLQTLPFSGRVEPLQHIFIGKDNVYRGQVGPIYSNVCVTQNP